MKYRFLFFLVLFLSKNIVAQDNDEIGPLNDIKLNSDISQFSQNVYFITGDEDLYMKYDWLRVSVKKNIENGIREGIYEGNTLNRINDLKASKTALYFYKGELFKIRWTFKGDQNGLRITANNINSSLISKYGELASETQWGMKIWEGKKNRLQTLLESTEFQIEYRDDKINQEVESLE